MISFIDQHRSEYGVEPICAQLPIAPVDLNSSPGTVKTHVNHLLSKLQVSDRTQGVIVAIKRGVVHLR
jgi:regulatory LuxR family protein